jgi:hypothetical protein
MEFLRGVDRSGPAPWKLSSSSVVSAERVARRRVAFHGCGRLTFGVQAVQKQIIVPSLE